MTLPALFRRQSVTIVVTALLVVVSAAAIAAAFISDPPSAILAFLGALGALVSIALISSVVISGMIRGSEIRLRNRVERVQRTVEETRAKASRHEWLQEQSLDRIERTAREVSATTAGLAWFRPREELRTAPAVPRVLFVTSNGSGMGHIARCAAAIRHSEGLLTGKILTLSTAASVVREAGYAVDYFPSYSATNSPHDRWRRQFTRRILEELAVNPVDIIAFDGTYVYPSLTDAAEYTALPLVWIRRGLWREGTDLAQVENWREYVDSVVVPGDIAETRETAPEPFRDAVWTAPVSLAPKSLLSRDEALASLGLDPGKHYALVQLSGGNGGGSATSAAVQAIRSTGDITPVVVDSPLLPDGPIPHALMIKARFPLVDYAAAWDFSVTGAGYNSVHESLHTDTPGIFLPSASTLTDDQRRRASALRMQAHRSVVHDPADMLRAVDEARQSVREREHWGGRRTPPIANGAAELAGAIAAVAMRRAREDYRVG